MTPTATSVLIAILRITAGEPSLRNVDCGKTTNYEAAILVPDTGEVGTHRDRRTWWLHHATAGRGA